MEFNRRNVKWIIELMVLGFLLYWLTQNYHTLPLLLGQVSNMFAPLLIGVLLGFIMNIPTMAIETHVFQRSWGKYDRWRCVLKRPLSLLGGFVVVGGIVALIMILVLPELQNTVRLLAVRLPGIFAAGEQFVSKFLETHPEVSAAVRASNLQIDKLSNILLNRVQNFATQSLNASVNFVLGVINSFFLFVFGLIFAVYGMLSKERLGYSARKLCYAFMPEQRAAKFIEIVSYVVATFTRYLSAQLLEALILGSLVFVGMSIFSFPYALIISALVALCALIPIFGVYISGAVGAFLIVLVDPSRVAAFLIMLLIIQQIEGNVIYPNVVGNKVGLPPLLVVAAVILGGRIFGFIGLLLCVPFSSVAYALLKYHAQNRLDKKGVSAETYARAAELRMLNRRIEEIGDEDEQVMSEARAYHEHHQRQNRAQKRAEKKAKPYYVIPIFLPLQKGIYLLVQRLKGKGRDAAAGSAAEDGDEAAERVENRRKKR